MEALFLAAFIAGILTFLAPCTFPLIPAYLGFISGVPSSELQDPEKAKSVRWKVFSNGVFYVLGFSLIFILFGVAAGFLSKVLIFRVILNKVGGIFLIVFGLILLGILNLPFFTKERQLPIPQIFRKPGKTSSFFVGSIFALGWSPCIGPLLGSILLLASTQGNVIQGASLLGTFSLGLAIPFLLVALLIGQAFRWVSKFQKAIKVLNIIGGVTLIALGGLLLTDNFTAVFNSLIGYFYQFDFFQNLIEGYF